MPPKADPRKLKDEAAKLLTKGKFAKAAEALEELAKVEPKVVEHLVKLGDAYRKGAEKTKAIEAYEKAAAQYSKGGLLIKAIAVCKMILELDSSHTATTEKLAELNAQRTGRPSGAAAKKPADKPSGAQAVETAMLESRIGKKPAPKEEPKKVEALELDDSPSGLELDTSPSAGAPKVAESLDGIDLDTGEPDTGQTLELTDAAEEEEGLDIDVGEAEETPAAAAKPAPARPAAKPAPKPTPKPAEPETLDLGMDLESGDDDLSRAMAEAEAALQTKKKPEPPPAKKEAPQAGSRGSTSQPAQEGEELDLDLAEPGLEIPEPEAADVEIESAAEEKEQAPVPAVVAPEMLLGSLTEEEGGLVAIDEGGEEEDEIEFALSATPAKEEDEGEPQVPAEPPAPPDFEPEPWPMGTPEPRGSAAEPEPSFLESPEEPQAPQPSADIPEIPLFSDLPKDAFVALTMKMGFRRVDAGEEIIRIGDPGDRFFIIATGKCKVYKPGADGGDVTLALLEDGAFFGEMALLSGNPRSASVASVTDCDLLEISAALLAEMVQQYPVVAGALRKFYKQRLLANVMALSPLFQPFTRVERRQLVEKFKMREVGENEMVLKQGQVADGLYVVLAGELAVEKDGSVLGPIYEGEIFGEVSLLNRAPAAASVRASRRSWLLRLPRKEFDEVIVTHPQVLELVAALTEERQKAVGMAL